MKTKELASRLLDEGFVIIDLETTGCLEDDPNTRIVQVTLLNERGKVLFSCLINPQIPIPEESTKIHGIRDADVSMAPTLPEVLPLLKPFLEGETVLVYNAGFDIQLLTTRLRALGLADRFEFGDVHCVMEMYQHWNGSRKWLPLPNLSGGKKHDALTDCINTLLLVGKMAGRATEASEVIDLDF